MKKALIAALISSGLLLAGCGGGGEPTTSASDVTSSASDSVSTSVDTSSEEPASTGESTDTSESVESSTSEDPTPGQGHTNLDVFDIPNGALPFGGEGEVGAGQMKYWAGDGGVVTSATHVDGTLSMTFTGGWAWYSVQIFYKAPYYNVGNVTYNVKMNITSATAGGITINGQVVTLAAGTAYEYDVDYTPGAGASTLLAVLGVSEGSSLSNGAASTITFSDITITDTTSTYYEVKFVDSDDSEIDTVMGMAGQPLWTSPTATGGEEGEIFDGWVTPDGTKVDLATYVPTADTTLKATYASADLDVNYYVGDEVVHTEKSYAGASLTAPTLGYDECGFGYGVMGWYTDSALTEEFDFATGTVGEDGLNLYAKLKIQYSELYQLEGTWIPETISWDEDGALIYSGDEGGWAEGWNKQMNFAPVPVGTAQTTYTISFEYKSNADFSAQIYDNLGGWAASSMNLTVSPNTWVSGSLTYTGGTISSNTKLSFEFGGKNTGTTNEFSLRNIVITPAI